jgi:hypothetical protein
MIEGEQDTVVYAVTDYTLSLLYAQEMQEKGFHVEALVFKKEKTKNILVQVDPTTSFELSSSEAV